MLKFKRFSQNASIKNLIRDRAGNIAMTFAILGLPLIGSIGVAIDYIRALNLHREIQSSLDAALVAAMAQIEAKNKNKASIQKHLENWLAAQATLSGSKYVLDTKSVDIDTSTHQVTATVTGSIDTSFLRVLGVEKIPVAVESSVLGGEETTMNNAFSMYLVLDRSGSMDQYTNTSYTTSCTDQYGQQYTCTKVYKKIEALKLAASDLLTQFDDIDPGAKYVRTGGVSYNNVMQTPSDLTWGTGTVLSYVNALSAGGTTNSGEAMEEAYERLEDSDEDKAHRDKNGIKNPDKYIVLMTDGENNVNGANSKTEKYCSKAKKEKMIVYSIAFMAPPAGQKLLRYCASSSGHYFSADNTKELVEAFKLIGATAAKKLIRFIN